jgi:hypothetical protein
MGLKVMALILMSLFLVLTIPFNANATPTQESYCETCHSLKPSLAAISTNVSSVTIMPDQTFHVEVTVNPLGLLESWIVKWPSKVEDNSRFTIDPKESQVYRAGESVSIIFSLKAPSDEATYTLRVYVTGKSKEGLFSNYVDLTVLVSTKPEEKPEEKPKLPVEKPVLDCLSCHDVQLKKHDVFGAGNDACYVCHDSRDMKSLHLINGTSVSLDNAFLICQQCHQERYDAWEQGIHGKPGEKVSCTQCHDPHKPYISGIPTLPPPEENRQEDSSVVPYAILFTILLVMFGTISLAKRRR